MSTSTSFACAANLSANAFDSLLKVDVWDQISKIDFQVIENDLIRIFKWSPSKCADIITEYKKFMYLCITNNDKQRSLIPCKDVDEVWHAHILRTEKYMEDCKIAGKQYIHHLPTPSDAAPANPSDFENGTKYLYENVFGSLPKSWLGKFPIKEVTDCGTCSYCGTCNGAGCNDGLAECGPCSDYSSCDADKVQQTMCGEACQTSCSGHCLKDTTEELALCGEECQSRCCSRDSTGQEGVSSIERISEINLKEVKIRLVTKYKWSEARADDGIEEYKKFLSKVVQAKSNLLDHSEDVEKIWENHILYTPQYKLDCEMINSEYIHHVPAIY